MTSPLVMILVIVAAGVLAWLLRGANRRSEDAAPSAPTPTAIDDPDDDLEDVDLDDAERRIPVTSEGVVFLPDGDEVRIVPLASEDETPDWVQDVVEDSSIPYSVVNKLYGFPAGGARSTKPGAPLNVGDFTAARVQRGGGDDPWRLETIGRDGDFGYFPFASQAGAVAALEMLNEHGIVARPIDDDGEPIPASSEDFEEARRRYDETERQLAIEGDPDDPEPRPDWSSRR